VAGGDSCCSFGKRKGGIDSGDETLNNAEPPEGAGAGDLDEAALWRGEITAPVVSHEWPQWLAGEYEVEEHESDDHSDDGSIPAERVCAVCDIACLEANEETEEEPEDALTPVRVKIKVRDGDREALLDSACYSIWVNKREFQEMGGYAYEEGGSAQAADGQPLNVAGQGKLDFCLWGRLFRGERVRVMESLPSRILIGRRFMIKNNMDLSLGNGTGKFIASTENG
jgi:hypothetical protein